MKGKKISFFFNLHIIIIHGWNNLFCYIFLLFYHNLTSKRIFLCSIYHIFGQNIFVFPKYHFHHLYINFLCRMSNLLENCGKSRMINNCLLNNMFYIWNINLHSYSIYVDYYPGIAIKKASSQSVYIFTSKTNKKDLIISSLLSFKLSGRRVYKCIL